MFTKKNKKILFIFFVVTQIFDFIIFKAIMTKIKDLYDIDI